MYVHTHINERAALSFRLNIFDLHFVPHAVKLLLKRVGIFAQRADLISRLGLLA